AEGQSGRTPLQVAEAVCCALGIAPEQDAERQLRLSLAATGTLQKPDLQTSYVQKCPSLVHGVLSARFTWVQPLAGTHESVVQALLSLQFGGAPPWQVPPLHWADVVQALLLFHEVFDLGWALEAFVAPVRVR